MLLGQYFGGRHQGALPTVVNRNGCCERGHHGFARAHIALQQTVHGHLALQVARDFFAHTALCTREVEGQHSQQFFLQTLCSRGQGRRTQQTALAFRLQLRELLCQQLFGLQALPCRMRAVFQLRERHIGCGVVQKVQGVF